MKSKRKVNKKNISIAEINPSFFRVSGNLIKKLGRESISNKNIAILELIKNAYDAKAAKVDIIFNDTNTPDANIIISDNGDGMDYTDLMNKWMTIATPNKSKIKKDGKRPIIGEKGIGRLSSENLGESTILYSYPRNESFGYKIDFDWEKYQTENVFIDQIQNKTFKFSKIKNKHGIKLEIRGLNHDWNDKVAQDDLLRDINLLNSINSPLSNFEITPKFNPSLSDVPKVKRNFLNKTVYKLRARLLGGISIKYEFTGKKKIKRKGFFNLDSKLKCGDSFFELHFFYKSPKYLKEALGVDMTRAEAKEITKILENYSGIKLYRDNFRVKPYGESKNDWIGLDIAAHNQSILPRNNAVIGMVHISRAKNQEIIDTTTREGVLYTDEFIDLISFIRTSIFKIFADLRSEVESKKKKAKKKLKTRGKKTKVIPVIRGVEAKEETLFELFGKYDLHPKIKNVSEKLFRDGYFKIAIQDALVETIDYVKQKSGHPKKTVNGKEKELDGDELMQRVFGCDERNPIIKFNSLSTNLEKAEQRGLMYLYKGIVGVRDKKAHLNFIQKDYLKTLDYLALASLLMRLLDEHTE